MQTIDSRLRFWMSFWLTGVVCACVVSEAAAQTDRPVRPPANRYLLVVETSRAMQHRLDGTLQVVADLINSGMAGQLAPRDTIGVWTYNNDLHTGLFPLQDWPSASRTNIVNSVQAFIRAQKLEKKPQFDKVMPTLQQVVRGSEYITVIIISSGEAPLHGTSYDSRINDFYNTWRAQQLKAHMPFIAVLRAQKGQFADCSVGAAPWNAELPALPAELVAARTVKVTAPAKKQTPAPLPPLIFSGHQQASEPVKPATDKSLTVTARPVEARAPASEPEAKPGPLASDKPIRSTTPSLQPQTLIPAAPVTNNSQPAGLQLQNASAKSAELTSPIAHSTTQTGASVEGSASAVHATNASPPASASSLAESAHPISTTNVASAAPKMGAGPQEPATSVPNAAPLYSKLLWFCAGVMFVLAALIFWRWREHTKAPVHISVITRSLERER